MKVYILDACAMIALFKKEEGWEKVAGILNEPEGCCYMHAVNLCEVFYDYRKTDSEEAAQSAIDTILNLGITMRHDLDREFWQTAGRIKAERRKVSLADCFCLTLAQRLSGTVVTCDRHEMEVIEQDGIVPIIFIR
jgi:PIN domain nuclease of toxin-antitoxin system